MKPQKILLTSVFLLLGHWIAQSADSPQTAANPTIYLSRGYSNPEMTAPYWNYPFQTLCPKYGFKPCYILFANDFLSNRNASGGWDLGKLLGKIGDASQFPKGAMVAIDLEDEGNHVWCTFDHHTGKPVPEAIDRYVTVIKACKLERPDLLLGYYSVVPQGGGWKYTDPKAAQQTEIVNAASKPIADAADFVAPSFYLDSKEFNLEKTLSWMRDAIAACKKHYPGKPIIPFLWPQWCDVRATIDQQAVKDGFPHGSRTQGFKFSPVQVEKATIPGKTWRALLDQLTVGGVKDIIIWGEGYYPWNDAAPWLIETLDWKK